MTTSGTIDGTMIASEIVTAAMREIGAIASGEAPTADELNDGLRSLSWMLKSWASGRGINLWREAEGSIVFPANTASVTLAPQPLDVLEARYVQSSTFERPLQRWENGQYRQIPNKATPGYPTAYLITKTVDGVTMTLWPVPQADSTILYTFSRTPEDVTDGAQTIDIPQAWMETVWIALAARLAGIFGATRINPTTAAAVAQRAASLEQLMFDQDRPASVFLGAYDEDYF
jgi:hypothetical protein